MTKPHQLRWAIVAPNAEVEKWRENFALENPLVLIEEGDQVKDPENIDILLLWKHPKGTLKRFKNVKLYYSLGAGVDHLMDDSSRFASVPICRIVDPMLSFSMSNYLIFATLHHQRKWKKFLHDRKEKIWDHDGLAERHISIGIMGLGTLGQDAAIKLASLGFEVSGYSPSKKEIPTIKTFYGEELSAFLKQCNVLICTVPYTQKTHQLLSKKLFDMMQHPTYLINVSRGAVQVEKDILAAIEKGQLSGAFLDVFEEEPLPKNSPLWTHEKVEMTPHNASITNPKAGVKQMLKNAEALINKKTLTHQVDPHKGY